MVFLTNTLLSAQSRGGNVRYIAHPLVKWISTTDDEDKKKREEYKKRYGSLKKAIKKLAEEELSES